MTHGEREGPCLLSFGGMHRAYVSQDLIQTMIHPSRWSRTKSTRVESSCIEPRGRPGRRLREWFESRPYTGGVVPSTYNYRKLASFCRAVSCPPFLIPHSRCALLSSDKTGSSPCRTDGFQNFDSERVLTLAQNGLE